MAVIAGQITPKLGPDSRPIEVKVPGRHTMWWCKLTLPAGTTYSTTDRIRFDHEGAGSCQKVLGSRIIKQILFSNGFSAAGFTTGEAKGEWIASAQQLSLRRTGTGAPGTGPLDDAEIANATGLGAGTITCEALVMV